MTPVYFPFTCINNRAAQMLRLCFPKTVLYLPLEKNIPETMKLHAEQGFLELRVPVKEDEEKLGSIVKEYQSWAQLHQGQNLSFFKTRAEKLPFFDEFSVHEILSDIRRKKEGKNRAEQNPDPLFQARIFLSISQEYDIHQWEVSRELESLSEMEAALLREVRGDEDEDTDTGLSLSAIIAKGDPGAHMTAERLNAWARLALCDGEISPFFLTTGTAIMEEICERIPEAQKVLQVNGISLYPESVEQWQEALADCLQKIAFAETIREAETLTAEENADAQTAFSLTVYRVSGTDSRGFLNRFIHPDAAFRTEGKNVLIGCMG